jgi:hypothetical protein
MDVWLSDHNTGVIVEAPLEVNTLAALTLLQGAQWVYIISLRAANPR